MRVSACGDGWPLEPLVPRGLPLSHVKPNEGGDAKDYAMHDFGGQLYTKYRTHACLHYRRN